MLQKNDKIIVLSSAVLCIFFAYKFLTFDTSLNSKSDSEKIAIVSKISASVKRKNEGSLNWTKLTSREDIYNGDQVFTDTSSEVTIVFDDASSIDVPQNTLIKIEKSKSNIEIDLQKGLVDLDLSKFKKSKVFFKIGEKVVTFDKSDSIVKIQNRDNIIKLSSSKGDVTLREVSSQTKESTQRSITIKRDQNIELTNEKDKKWKRELSKVGKRVDSRLIESQAKKIDIILSDELVTKSKNEKLYRNVTRDLSKRSIELEISPKEIVVNELSFLAKEGQAFKNIEKAISRVKTVRNLQTLQSSVVNYIDSRFDGDEVLIEIAKEKVKLAKKDKAIVSNEQLMAIIGEEFDSLGVSAVEKKKEDVNLHSEISKLGQKMNKKIAYTQFLDIRKQKDSNTKINQVTKDTLSKVYIKGSGSSPINEAIKLEKKLSSRLNSFESSKSVNKEVLRKLVPILRNRASSEKLKQVEDEVMKTKFSQANLNVDEQLLSLDSIKEVLTQSSQKSWSIALDPIVPKVERVSKGAQSGFAKDEVVLNSIKKEFHLSEQSEVEPIKNVVESLDLSAATTPRKAFEIVAKKLDQSSVSLPTRLSENSWTARLAKIGEDKDIEYSKVQLEQLENFAPEVSKVVKVDKYTLVSTPKEIVRKKLDLQSDSLTKAEVTQLKKAVSLTSDIEVNKQELFETIQNELGLPADDQSTKLIQQHLQQQNYKGDKLELRDSLTSLGKKLDKLKLDRPFVRPKTEPTFLNKLVVTSSSVVQKPFSRSVVAGNRESIVISKPDSDKSRYNLELSKTADFSQLVFTKELTSKVANINFSKSGEYFYRVAKTMNNSEADSFKIKHTDSPKSYSKVRQISVSPPASPVVKPPMAGVVEMKTFTSFPVEWSGPKRAVYEVEITQKANSIEVKPISRVVKVSGNSAKLDLSKFNLDLDAASSTISAKDLTYRVRRAGVAKSEWSETISPKVRVAAAVIPKKGELVQVKRRFQKNAKLNFEWNSTLPDQSHILTVAKDKDFEKVIAKKEVRGTSATVSSNYEGALYWKVVPKKLATTQAPVLKREVLSSTIRIDKKVVKKVILKATDAAVTKVDLGWRYTRATKTAQKKVELATDPEFKNIIDEKVVDTAVKKTQFDLKSNGQYYWRVKDIGKGAANISGVNSFEVVTGVDLPVPSVLPKQIIKFKIVNDLPAYEILLPNTPQAVMIELEVYADEQLTKLIFKKKFRNSKALWVTNRSGKFFYRARGIDKIGRYSKYSSAGKLIFPISPLINSDLE